MIMFSPCVFVCLWLCLCIYHDVCPDDLTMKDWCNTNNILRVHCWGCLVVQVMFHALMTSSMTSPGHKVGHILKVIYLRQYLSYSFNQKLKMSEMLMAFILVYSTSGKKSLSRAHNSGHFENFEILITASIWPQIWKDRPKLCQKSIFMMMTSLMTSPGGLKVGPLYSVINEIMTFFMITKQRAKISLSNFLCICIIRLWLQLYEDIFMTSLMTSPGHKIGQILTLIYLRQYLKYSVDQKLIMSEMMMAIFLVYSPSGITSGKKSLSRAQNSGHFEILKY